MSSPTIRYSGVPENSHSRDFESDTAAYTRASRHETRDRARHQAGNRNPGRAADQDHDSDLTRRFRIAAAAENSGTAAGPAPSAPSGLAPGFTPGKAAPVGDDPRHNRAYPHPKNPGLFTDEDGFYDWADRRLFLTDGSPDPMTPGAYRYQTRPDLCDLDAPDSDPSSPRYEPDHLRHKPGDTWMVDERRPYDALDPGPFGSPDWFPDLRTGRHRRDELPDPIPWWEVEEEPEKAEWAEHAEALWERRTRKTREREAREAEGREARGAGNREVREVEGRVPRESREREAREAGNHKPRELPGSAPAEPLRIEEPSPPGRSDPPTGGPDPSRSQGDLPDRPQDRPQVLPQSPAPERTEPARRPAPGPSIEPPYRFSKLREDAWDRFLLKSAPLAAAHLPAENTADRTVHGTAHRPAQDTAHRQDTDGPGRTARLVRRLADAVRRSRRRHRSNARNRPAGPPVPRQPANTRPSPTRASADHTAIALRSSRMASALRGGERARAETATRRTVPEPDLGSAAWA